MRIKLTYKQKVEIPSKYKKFFWDEPEGVTFLEKFILRILKYGDFEDIKWLYQKYPEETYAITFKYPDIKRGIKFWMKKWHEDKRNC